MEGTVYILEPASYAWIFPAGIILGILLQIHAGLRKHRFSFFMGLFLVLPLALYERDIALAAGDILASLGMWLGIFSKPENNRKS